MKILFICLSAILLAHGLHGAQVVEPSGSEEDLGSEEAQESSTMESRVCPGGFINLDDRCYHFSTKGQSWYNAIKTCISLGANLASLETFHENNIVQEYLRELDPLRKFDFWISASDDSQEGVFVWVNTMELVTVTDWCQNDPNNVSDESCVHMVASCDYRWQERSCDYTNNYICEV